MSAVEPLVIAAVTAVPALASLLGSLLRAFRAREATQITIKVNDKTLTLSADDPTQAEAIIKRFISEHAQGEGEAMSRSLGEPGDAG